MVNSLLGKQIDIHTGGIEHIAIHHNNEIAQSEAATGKHPFSRFWMHRAHIRMNDAKMAKSEGNVAYLSDVIERTYHPLALRYWFLTSHYRANANFTWEALDAAQKAYLRLRRFVDSTEGTAVVPAVWKRRIRNHLNDDLDTPGAIAALWDMSRAEGVSPAEVKAAILFADDVLGLGFEHEDPLARRLYEAAFGSEKKLDEVPAEIAALVREREQARLDKNFGKADELRDELLKRGYRLEDSEAGPRVVRIG
jgi:cysteinyl-tRNA synthetase